ncbi:MAG: cytochrome c biogenesis protein CcsA [Desulfovibrionales bacterium]|nr:cytochrome c biogenesis protein CcsA [Desulfovibrionales bacterium]
MQARSSHFLTVLALAAALAMCAGQYAIWLYAPEEVTMGVVQKIFYVHLPLAWWAFAAFFGVFVTSVLALWKGTDTWDCWAGVLAELGVLFSGLALITGSLWGRAAWNTWWTWDPRLSTTLIMWFVYAGYLVLRAADVGGAKGARVRAVLGIVAFLDVPLVFLSARLWRSIHPAVFASKGGGLAPEMWTTVWINIIAWGILGTALAVARYRNERLHSQVQGVLATMHDHFAERG